VGKSVARKCSSARKAFGRAWMVASSIRNDGKRRAWRRQILSRQDFVDESAVAHIADLFIDIRFQWSIIRDAHGDVADLSVEVVGEVGLNGGERGRGVGRVAEKEVDIAITQVGSFGVGACEFHRLKILFELHLKYALQSIAGAVPMARRRWRRRIKKNIRLWSGELMVLPSKDPCSRQHPISSWVHLRRLVAKVGAVQTEVVARSPASIAGGLVASRPMTDTDVRRSDRTEAAFSAASRSHWREKVGFTSNTA